MLTQQQQQELFDRAWWHLGAQGRRAVVWGKCAYFDRVTGHRCAIGGLVSEEGARWLEENHPGARVVQIQPEHLEYVGLPCDWFGVSFLTALQEAHDDDAGPDLRRVWERLRKVASRYGLTVPGEKAGVADAR